jgi:multiple sugar transport system substrate-binding protein
MKILMLTAALGMIMLSSGCLRTGIIVDEHHVLQLDDEAVKTIVVWHTYSDEETRVFEEEIIPSFEQENPKIRIESIRQGSNVEYQAALIARASAEKTPDVIRMDYSWVPRFASYELLLPLENFPDYERVAAEQRGHMLHTNQYNGHVYGLPLNMNTKAAIYNRKLMQEAGLGESPESMLDIVKAAREHRLIIGMIGLELWSSLPYFHGLGGVLADKAFTQTIGYFNSDSSVEAVQTLLDLYNEGILNPGMLDGTSDLWNDLYKDSANMLMIDEGPWYYSILLNAATLNVDLLDATVPAPFPANGQYGSIIGGESLVMTKGTRHQDEAWTFIRFMMRKDTQQTMYKTGLFPTNMEAFQGDNMALIGNQYMEPYVKGIDHAFYRPPLPQWHKIEMVYFEAMEDIFVRGRDVRAALDEAAAKMDALLIQ